MIGLNKKAVYKLDLDSVNAGELLERIRRDISELREICDIKPEEIIELALEEPNKNFVPISAFTNTSPLEGLVKYLKDELGLSFNEISKLLNRNYTTVWTTYNNAKKKKLKEKRSPEEARVLKKIGISRKDEILIPTSIFKTRKLSILESVVMFLKEKHKLKNHQIAVLLNKDDRTIWTAQHRARVKLHAKKR